MLRFAYEFSPQAICVAFRKLFGLQNVNVGNAQLLAQAIDWHEQGLNFADAFHLALSQQHSKLKTFDSKFVKRAKRLSRCAVEAP